MADALLRDETMAGRELESWLLPDLPDQITARELVRLRVREEVARLNTAGSGQSPPRPDGRINWEVEADAACESFSRNGFVMLAGERRIDDLDELIDLRRGNEIAFVRLIPLADG